ncbi:MAG TPA: helix-turn-helix domain-containing protein [Blastocatellia bacterium]|nr:helix-turn-helix domain-containing protein [Blastocatellia bacterium]
MRILEAAARLFRKSGYDGVGVDAIMSEAGLTAGGFYAHFSSKEALFAETMATALELGRTMQPAKASAAGSLNPLTALLKSYLRAHTVTKSPRAVPCRCSPLMLREKATSPARTTNSSF